VIQKEGEIVKPEENNGVGEIDNGFLQMFSQGVEGRSV
jgi:hypothetical protein